MEATIKRKYVLTRLEAGDYLLPSNDAKTLWRIAQYEDGPSHGLTDWPRDRKLWGVYRWTKGTPLQPEDVDDWTAWEMVASGEPTRKDAINAALGVYDLLKR